MEQTKTICKHNGYPDTCPACKREKDSESPVAACYEFKDADGDALECDCWYWITAHSEGDIWYPVYVSEVYYMMDGKSRRDFNELAHLVVKKAVLPN